MTVPVPDVKALMAELAQIVDGLKVPVPETTDPEELERFTTAHQALVEERHGQLKAFAEKVKGLPKPPKPKMPRLPRKPNVSKPVLSLGPRTASHPYVIDKMLEVAGVTKDDILYDLGSGDGRIVERAADTYRLQAGGVEIHPGLVDVARKRALVLGLKSHVDYVVADAETFDLSRATVVTLFLSPDGNLKLRPRLLAQLKNGARVVSNTHDMGDWKPDVVAHAKDHRQEWHPIYLWHIRK
jgi:hypothetical protein